ncbi:glucuronate isomerase [Variovorax sp. HJSM1_2]|uniref:glucuronate isomerase n=1 Tax=Variovorax sp. HJSM1_2 TaxID=3366263 RepID=UPI003BC42760
MAETQANDLLLTSRSGRALFHEVAAPLPIIDFHCHVDPQSVADDQRFGDITDLWIRSDPYKWRAMRINGVSEAEITGAASHSQKFHAWARTLPLTVGSPLFHWSALELRQVFGIESALAPTSASAIWDRCNTQLAQPGFSARALLRKANVEVLCTSDDLLDSLASHAQMRLCPDASPLQMLPSLRADRVLTLDASTFAGFCKALSLATGIVVESLDAYKAAISKRLDAFDALGCRFADVGLEQVVCELAPKWRVEQIFEELLSGQTITPHAAAQLQTDLLLFLARQYHRRDWVMQMHLGAQRETSARLKNLTGRAGGYACIGNSVDVSRLVALLNQLEQTEQLPRTLLFPLNPADMEMLASVGGAFVEEGVPGKVQLGPAWWFNDHRDGMERLLKVIGNLGLLSRHIGMTTDSRSLLSYSRHGYFRRILCNLLGSWADAGEIPNDMARLSKLVQDVCYFNAKRWMAPPSSIQLGSP